MKIAMSWIIVITLLAGLTLGLGTAGCSQEPETATPDNQSEAAKPYPLKTCLVSGEELGSMGKPVSLVHDGQEIKFCCQDCVDEFKSDPGKYLAKLKTEAVPAATEP